MLPNLLHPVAIEIEQLQRADTLVDPDYREPVQQAVRGPRTVCPGQVKWGMDEKLRSQLTGAEQDSDGYVLFRPIDLRAVGLGTISMGDRFTAFGTGANKRLTDVYVVAVRGEGHYPDQGGAALLKAFFKDRSPGKQTKGGK